MMEIDTVGFASLAIAALIGAIVAGVALGGKLEKKTQIYVQPRLN